MRSDIKEMERAIRENDAVTLTAVAHRVKGVAASLCISAIQENAMCLELMGRDANLSGAEEKLAAILEVEKHLSENDIA